MEQVLILKAPISGPLIPLEAVPDPVFAQKMVGDGISIDPVTNLLISPCAGTVTQIHPAHHAVTVTTADGIEVLMHIGLDTVQLRGSGFTPRVKVGDKVLPGAALIEFEPDFVATHAKSLMTEVVIANSDRIAGWQRNSGLVKAGEDVILELSLAGEAGAAAENSRSTIVSPAIVISNETGLHARPAAVLSHLARKFKGEISLRKDDREANAKSVVSLMALGAEFGDKVTIVAAGADAQRAIDELMPIIAAGLGDQGTVPLADRASVERSPESLPLPKPRPADPNMFQGVTASSGLAVGRIFQVRREELRFPEKGETPAKERRRLEDALDKAKLELEALQKELQEKADAAKAAIFAAHQELLEDPDLLEMTESAIAKGQSAAFGWNAAVNMQAQRLAAMKNELLAARANDMHDAGQRVMRLIIGIEAKKPEIPPDSILVAEDLTPSDTASLDRSRVLGFATVGGGSTSHVAIIARSLGIAAVAGVDPLVLDVETGAQAILDGAKGTLRVRPPEEEVRIIRERQEKAAKRRKAEMEHAFEPALTADGVRIEVAGNIGDAAEAGQVVASGGEGVGLLRSELLFLDRADAPSEDEQYEVYAAAAKALGPERPLVIRTLDVGGDKPLRYLPMPREDNPFLGQRGLRIGLERPEILRTQLRAIFRAAGHGRVLVMFPMVAVLSEIRSAKAIMEEVRAQLGARPIPVGVMIEIPSAALLASQFAREVDFFSLGTNDLTQYTLAMDRGHPKLAPLVDGLDPGVLALIGKAAEGAAAHKRWIGVCGGLAGDPQAIPILIGLGVTELSVSPPSIPSVKAQIRRYSMAQCKELAARALEADGAAAVRAMVKEE